LIWKIHGKRLDGFHNDDVPSPGMDYGNEQDVLNWSHHSHRFKFDIDYAGSAMPPPEAVAGTYKSPAGKPIKVPPLSAAEKLTLAQWIDIGCPIDLDYDPQNPTQRGRGWMLDEGRPTLTVTYPRKGENTESLSRILIGMHDYYTGLEKDSLKVIADFSVDNAAAGANLASRFRQTSSGVWELKLKKPIVSLTQATLVVSIKDREGNLSQIKRTFSIGR
jgi:hypothetical protein